MELSIYLVITSLSCIIFIIIKIHYSHQIYSGSDSDSLKNLFGCPSTCITKDEKRSHFNPFTFNVCIYYILGNIFTNRTSKYKNKIVFLCKNKISKSKIIFGTEIAKIYINGDYARLRARSQAV